MDTTTVLQIIKMIDTRLKYLHEAWHAGMTRLEYEHQARALTQLADHLQSFIEGQLNGAENQTGE